MPCHTGGVCPQLATVLPHAAPGAKVSQPHPAFTTQYPWTPSRACDAHGRAGMAKKILPFPSNPLPPSFLSIPMKAWFDGPNKQSRVESFGGVDSVFYVGVGVRDGGGGGAVHAVDSLTGRTVNKRSQGEEGGGMVPARMLERLHSVSCCCLLMWLFVCNFCCCHCFACCRTKNTTSTLGSTR